MAANGARRLKSVALLGAGTQGRRLAFMWSRQGRKVNVIDPDERQLKAALTSVHDYQKTWTGAKPETWGRIETFDSSHIQDAISDAWMVVEAVPERLSLKRDIVRDLDLVASKDTILASNSSSYTISEIIKDQGLRHPERAVSLHAYWPPETSSIEVMGHEGTSESVVETLMTECKMHGFTPYRVKRNSTGYLYNRIWAAIKRESLLVVSEGVGTPEEVDGIFRDVLKTPKGPCEQMDVVGLDVALNIEEHYAEVRSGLPEAPRELLRKMIADGKLGVKNGRGFYEYNGGKSPAREE